VLNAIRADIYKLLRGKGLYITLLVVIIGAYITISGYTGINSVSRLHLDTEVLPFFLIAIITIIIMPMFTNGTVKNTLAWGMPRAKLYFSKLLLCFILCVLITALFMGSGLLISTVINGWGGETPGNFFINMLKTTAAQLLFLLAYTAIGVFLAFTIKKSIALISILFTIAFAHVVVRVIADILSINPEPLMRFEIIRSIRTLSQVTQLEAFDVHILFAVGVMYIIVSTVAGIILFNKAEIK